VNDALKTLDAILRGAAAGTRSFPPNSRYHGIPTTVYVDVNGRELAYLTRRFVPQPEEFALVSEHATVQEDRLDQIAARYFGDAELFWRLADANGAVKPDELIATIGRRLRITLPRGIPGAPGV
jgi:hypothetical protein